MKCIIDTNILVSASLFPQSVPAQAFAKATAFPNVAVICDYSIDEMRRVYNKKFPHKIYAMDEFLSVALIAAEVIVTPPDEESVMAESAIRDTKDRPILRAAIKSDADILISGDKDFLESGIQHPKILNPTDFLKFDSRTSS
jgi:putative PIN family toxin of toxin-antitoxin system